MGFFIVSGTINNIFHIWNLSQYFIINQLFKCNVVVFIMIIMVMTMTVRVSGRKRDGQISIDKFLNPSEN